MNLSEISSGKGFVKSLKSVIDTDYVFIFSVFGASMGARPNIGDTDIFRFMDKYLLSEETERAEMLVKIKNMLGKTSVESGQESIPESNVVI